MTTTIRSSADGSKSYITVGGTDRVTIDAATGKLTSTYSPPTGERSLALATMQKFADEFGASLAANGYQKLPSGLILQWGTFTGVTTADVTASFPIAFPVACVYANIKAISATVPPSSGKEVDAPVKSVTTTQITLKAGPDTGYYGGSFYWFAIGY